MPESSRSDRIRTLAGLCRREEVPEEPGLRYARIWLREGLGNGKGVVKILFTRAKFCHDTELSGKWGLDRKFLDMVGQFAVEAWGLDPFDFCGGMGS